MVKKWEKNLISIQKSTGIDFHKVLQDIQADKLKNYDVLLMTWYKNKYRVRIWSYRIIFDKIDGTNIVRNIATRWSIYKQF